MKKNHILILFLFTLNISLAQNNNCNKLGAWIWVIEETTCKTHTELADSLKKLNIKEVFVKVADGKNFSNWPELDDKALVKAYKDKGIKVWGWTYNYPSNETAQAEAIYRAAKTGYEGFVIDVEIEFDGDSLALYKLMSAFGKRKNDAINDGIAKKDFQLRATTWGNPKAHKFNIRAMDQFVDAHMPQTYVEQWDNGNPSKGYVKNLESWIETGNKEYKSLGATKPIYHILASEREFGTVGAITVADVNKYFAKSGGNTTLWRIPGGAIKSKNWQLWRGINWKKDFCTSTSVSDAGILENAIVYPNPFTEILNISFSNIENKEVNISLINTLGQIIRYENIGIVDNYQWNLSELKQDFYLCSIRVGEKLQTFKIIKQ